MSTTAGWEFAKSRIKSQWSALTDGEIERARGNISQLKDQIQKVYGFDAERAQREFDRFMEAEMDWDSDSENGYRSGVA